MSQETDECDVKSSLESLGKLLEAILDNLSKKRGNNQLVSDIQAGQMRTAAGIIIPFHEHRFVYDTHDLTVLRAYLRLFQHALLAEDEIFVQMSFRILQELGIKRIGIFFSESLRPVEIKKVTLVSVLSDWILIGTGKYYTNYQKLFAEDGQQLDDKGQKIFKAVADHIATNQSRVPPSLLKPVRRYRDNILHEYARRIPDPNFLKGLNLEMIHSFYSELMHGNAVMLEQLFDKNQVWRGKNRLRALLWYTGQNVLRTTYPLTEDTDISERAKELIEIGDCVWEELVKQWKEEGARNE